MKPGLKGRARKYNMEGHMFVNTFWSLVPPIVAIALALITKEVYSSLFIGIVCGGLLYSGFSLSGTIDHVLIDGIIGSVSDSYNVGILVFLVVQVYKVLISRHLHFLLS